MDNNYNFNLIDKLSLFNGLNVNPIPLEFSQALSTTEMLASIEASINVIIKLSNDFIINANKYTDSQKNNLQTQIDNLMLMLQNGNIIPNGSIDLAKLNPSFLKNLQNIAIKYVHESASFVTFGLSDDGHFMVYIPETWSDIIFSTDTEGHLILNF